MSASRTLPDQTRKLGSFDIARVFAMVLVTIQHLFSVNDLYDKTIFFRTSVGQYGVAIFCALSGFLAFQDKRLPSEWLRRRLVKLFPAYWIATIAAFALTSFAGHESFDAYQFVSQMLGLGFFTHGFNLVNVVSWFISMILLCYIFGFLGKLWGKPIVVMSIVVLFFSAALAARAVLGLKPHMFFDLSQHVISFAIGAIAGILPSRKRLLLLVGASLACAASAVWARDFAYAGVSLFCLWLSLSVSVDCSIISRLAVYTYEYFLVHGIALVGAVKFFPRGSVLAMVAGLIGALIGAWLLKWVTAALTKRVSWLRG